MTTPRRAGLALTALLFLPACADNLTTPTTIDSVTGTYTLTSLDGQPLPFWTGPDSAGTNVGITGGTLTLGEAARTAFGATPAGLAPVSCIHEIPDGAYVDFTEGDHGVVHLPDGSTYELPPCGDGPYRLVLNRRVQITGGGTTATEDTTTGLYAWGPLPWGDTTEIMLVGSALAGPVTRSHRGLDIRLTRPAFGAFGPGPNDHEYRFLEGGN